MRLKRWQCRDETVPPHERRFQLDAELLQPCDDLVVRIGRIVVDDLRPQPLPPFNIRLQFLVVSAFPHLIDHRSLHIRWSVTRDCSTPSSANHKQIVNKWLIAVTTRAQTIQEIICCFSCTLDYRPSDFARPLDPSNDYEVHDPSPEPPSYFF
jgi:hypothetical protein